MKPSTLLLRVQMQLTALQAWRKLKTAAQEPQAAQDAVLKRILKSNQSTHFGKTHRFSAIFSYADFAGNVPVADYEMLRSAIRAQMHGAKSLTEASPVLYEKTSGTTALPKYIPVTGEELSNHRRYGKLLAYCQYRCQPSAFDGVMWVMSSPETEEILENGLPCGSASGLLYAHIPKCVARRLLLPAAVFGIQDIALKYRVILRLALAQRDITYLNAANPTTLLRMCELANEWGPTLVDDIRTGGLRDCDTLPEHVKSILKNRLGADPKRAEELKAVFASGEACYASLWPSLSLVVAWTGGNCNLAVNVLRGKLPSHTRIMELGYLSSEFRGTLTVDCERGAGLPTLTDYFFEFIEPSRWEAGERTFKRLHELVEGQEYFIVVTTPSGLYRYFINDIVRAEGRWEATPCLRFIQKGKGVTSITGEKLYESQVNQALERALNQSGIELVFHLMLADIEAQAYMLYVESVQEPFQVESLAICVDDCLQEINLEYRAKRESGRLRPLSVVKLMKGAGEAYRSHSVKGGQKEGQFKMLTLQYAHQCDFPFGWVN